MEEKIKNYIKKNKKEIALCALFVSGIGIAYFCGKSSGIRKGIMIGAKADSDFIKTQVPEAAKLVFEFAEKNPGCLLDTDEFIDDVVKRYL